MLLKIISNLIVLIPLALITGPFLPDLIVVISSLLLLLEVFRKKQLHYFLNFYFLLFIIFCIYLIISSLLSDFPIHSLSSSLFYFRFGFLVIGIIYVLDHDNSFIRKFTYCIIVSFIILGFDGLFQFFFDINSTGIKYDGKRLSGISGEFIIGSYFSRFLPIIIGLSIVVFKRYTNFAIMIIIIFSSIIIYLSGERAAFFYLLVQLIIFSLFIRYKIKIKIAFILIFISLVFLSSLIVPETKNRMIDLTFNEVFGDSLYDPEGENKINMFGFKFYLFSALHQAHYKSAFKIYTQNKLIGSGPKNFRKLCNKDEYWVKFGCQTHPHNTYVQLLSETGLIGFSLIMTTFIIIFYKIIYLIFMNNFNYLERNQKIELFFYTAIFINLWPFIPSGNFFNNYLSIVYFIPFGFLIHFIKKKKYSKIINNNK